MKEFNVWIRKTTTVIIGGQGDKPIPVVTMELTNPQIKIDEEKGTITITETK